MSLDARIDCPIGLGTFPFANPFSPVSRETAVEVLDAFFGAGGIYVDVSPTYSFGEVEQLLGDYLRSNEGMKSVVNTSCGYVREGENFRVSGAPDDVRQDFRESLDRLGLDRIDMYMSHIPDPDTPLADTAKALGQLKSDGSVGTVGVSNVSLDQLVEYNQHVEIDFIQNRFSLLNQAIPAEMTEYCISEGISIIGYQVVERGLLTNANIRGLSFGGSDLRSRKPEFETDVIREVSHWVKTRLTPIAEQHETSVESLAVAWALSRPGVEIVQCGATKPEQIKAIFSARKLAEDSIVISTIDRAREEFSSDIADRFDATVREFMGLETYDVYGGSASGK